LTIEGRKTAKVDGGYDGGKYIKKVNNLAIPCYSLSSNARMNRKLMN
jgi:hypothetical protein